MLPMYVGLISTFAIGDVFHVLDGHNLILVSCVFNLMFKIYP
jgi:hypothetical protein